MALLRQIKKEIRLSLSSNKLALIAILSIATYIITPVFYVKMYAMGFLFIFTLFFFNTYSRYWDISLKSMWVCGILYSSICFLYKICGISSAKIGYCLDPTLFFLMISIFEIIESSLNTSQIKVLFHAICLVIAFNITDGIIISSSFANGIMYQQLAEALEEEGVTGLNLGGSHFVNMVAFYINVVVFSFFKSNNKLEKCLFLLYTLISLWFLVSCTFKASTIMIAALSIIGQYIAHIGKGRIRSLIIVAVICFSVLYFLLDDLIYYIISISGSDRLATRLLVLVSSGSDSAGGISTLESREGLWQVSLETWTKSIPNFFFGIGDHAWNAFSSTALSGIGNHSDLLDSFARYGIIGGSLVIAFIVHYYKHFRDKYLAFYKYEIIVFVLAVVLMGLTKKFLVGESAVIILILFPLCLSYHKNKIYEHIG